MAGTGALRRPSAGRRRARPGSLPHRAPLLSPAIVRATSLTFGWRAGEPLLRDVELELSAGRVTCLVGPNGCGKTTLARVLVGDLDPALGAVSRPPGTFTAMRYQNFSSNLLPWYTARYNLAVAGADDPDSRTEAVDRLLDAIGYDRWKEQRTGSLSGGQQQALSVAAVLWMRAALTVLDEPFSAVDPTRLPTLWPILRSWAAEVSTVLVVVTHNLDEAALLGDEVLVMKPGPPTRIERIAVDRTGLDGPELSWSALDRERSRLSHALFALPAPRT